MIGFLFCVFGLFVRFVCMAFLVSGVGIMFGFVPFRTCPLLAQLFVCPLSFFVCLVWLPTTFSLFLSLSGAGETQTPFGVWVSPCVLFFLDADFVDNPYIELSTFPKASPPHLPFFFFFFFRRRRSRVCWWLVWLCLFSGWLGGFFGAACLVALHARSV